MNRTAKLFLAALVATAMVPISILEDHAIAQSSTSGAVRGVIRDKKTGKPIEGATVFVTSTMLQGQQDGLSDENGFYTINNLPPGTYTLTVIYADATFTRGNVLIQVGKQAVINVPIDTGTKGGETIIIEGSAPVVDQGSTKTGVTITDDYTRNIPVGRTFGAVLGSAAGAQGDSYGQSFSGSTSVENTYIVEGINTTDTAFGLISSNLPNEFVEETEVITGGYAAEFGRSTGGVVNVVTKQGSNELKGTAFAYFTPGQLVADAEKIQREGQAISTRSQLDYSWDVGAEVGGPIIKDKLWFHAGINPSFRRTKLHRTIATLLDEDGDGSADIDPTTGFTKVCEDESQCMNGIATTTTPLTYDTYYFTGKINGAISQDHQAQLSVFGNPRKANDLYSSVSAPSRRLYKLSDGAWDAALKWTSKFADDKTQIDAVVGYHKAYSNEDPYDAAGAAPRLSYRYERALSDFSTFEGAGYPSACTDGGIDDPYPMIDNCPVLSYGIGGVGYLESRDNNRISAAVSLTQRVKFLGYHTFKLGGDVEQATYDAFNRYTGGRLYQQSGSTAWQIEELVGFDDAGTIGCVDTNHDEIPDAYCSPVASLRGDTKTRNLAAYLQDSWQVRPNLTFNLGLRWEQQTAFVAEHLQGTLSPDGERVPDVAFKLNNMLAPRIGVIFDPTREGRSKLFAHAGRFYESVPLRINVRGFGGEMTHYEVVNSRNPAYDNPCPEAAGATTPEEIDGCRRVTQTVLGAGTEYVSPGLKGQHIDELIFGAEYELADDFKVGATFVHREMPTVIEDISTDGGNTYLITNPGADLSADADALRAQAEAVLMDGDPDNDGLADLYESRAFQLDQVGKFDAPVRNYDAVQLTASQRFSANLMAMASYTYSRSKGNFPGLYSTETDQLDPNLSSMYDLPDLMANRYGAMGLDRPHLLKVDVFYQFHLGKKNQLVLGGSGRAQSGLGINTLAAHPIYGSEESYVLPRGSIERTPMTWQADVKLAFGRKLGKANTLEAFVDIFNLFNQQASVGADENYTTQSMNPIVGGDTEDLRHGKVLDDDSGGQVNSSPVLNPNFRNLNSRQSPMSVRFGLRFTF